MFYQEDDRTDELEWVVKAAAHFSPDEEQDMRDAGKTDFEIGAVRAKKQENAQRKVRELTIMERYCESKGCLRKQMLGYFGQGFDEADCMFRDRRGFNFAAMCHNCAKRTPMKLRNVTNLCQIVLIFMREAASVGLLTLSKNELTKLFGYSYGDKKVTVETLRKFVKNRYYRLIAEAKITKERKMIGAEREKNEERYQLLEQEFITKRVALLRDSKEQVKKL